MCGNHINKNSTNMKIQEIPSDNAYPHDKACVFFRFLKTKMLTGKIKNR